MIHRDELVWFVDKSTNKPLSRVGIRIGNDLIISKTEGGHKIYRLDGRLFLPFRIVRLDDAKKVASWLEKVYNEYIPILYEYPALDLFSLTKYTVRNGVRIFLMIEELKRTNTPLLLDDIKSAYWKVNPERWSKETIRGKVD